TKGFFPIISFSILCITKLNPYPTQTSAVMINITFTIYLASSEKEYLPDQRNSIFLLSNIQKNE
ncbi:MAG: hypothetical protein ACXWWC_14330, partial [Chitinophagaceae bacterium]